MNLLVTRMQEKVNRIYDWKVEKKLSNEYMNGKLFQKGTREYLGSHF